MRHREHPRCVKPHHRPGPGPKDIRREAALERLLVAVPVEGAEVRVAREIATLKARLGRV